MASPTFPAITSNDDSMLNRMRVCRFFLLVFFAAFAVAAQADNAQQLEPGLLKAMHLKKGTSERSGGAGKAIRAYKRLGYVNQKPNQRADYVDYYLMKKPASFMGHELVVIEEEYMSNWVGCCVSPGVGVSVKVTGSTVKLEEFALANKCGLTDQVALDRELRSVGVKVTLPKARYASLSCRERDATRDL